MISNRIRRGLLACAAAVVTMTAVGAGFAAGDDLPPLMDPKRDQPGLNVGDVVPDITVFDENGREVNLKQLFPRARQTVVMFYRGGWCPYCNKSLKEWGQRLGSFQDKEVQVIAISPETAEHSSETKSKDNVGFKVYVDQTTEAMRAFKVAFQVEESYVSMLRKRMKVELGEWNASGEEILPAPAFFLVNSSGQVTWKWATWDYEQRRPSPDDLLEMIDEES